MTLPLSRSHGKTRPLEAKSAGGRTRTAVAPASHSSTQRREAILDAALLVATSGGYEAVQMRSVAERAGIAVGTLYRHFPAKTNLLVAALSREFRRLDSADDWASGDGTPLERLERLTTHLHDRWQRDPWLTSAMTRAFAVADTRAAAELDCAAAEIQTLLARTLRSRLQPIYTSPRSSPTCGWPTSWPFVATERRPPILANASTWPLGAW